MCFLFFIEFLIILRVWFLGAVNKTFHIIVFIFYMIFWSLKEINVFFWWGDPGMPVDKNKGLNHVYRKLCTMRRAIHPCKGEFPLIFILRLGYWKMMVARWDNIGDWSWCSLYQVRTYSFSMAVCAAAVLHKTLNSNSTLSLSILPTL